MKQESQNLHPEIVYGRNAVAELLKGNAPVECLYIQQGERSGSMGKILHMAKEKHIPTREVPLLKLTALCEKGVHQGVAALLSAAEYRTMEDIFSRATQREEPLFVVLCNGIEDPHNLGAILRTAEGAGAHGVIIPERRSVGLTATVFKTSAGAAAHIPVVRVPNLVRTIDELKEKGVFIFGADMDGQDYRTVDWSGPVGLVIGAEGTGLSRLVREHCDGVVSLPLRGQIESLNASVAAGILLYEVVRHRL